MLKEVLLFKKHFNQSISSFNKGSYGEHFTRFVIANKYLKTEMENL